MDMRAILLSAALATRVLVPATAIAESAAPASPTGTSPPLTQPFSGTWRTAPVTHEDLQAISFSDADLAWFDSDQGATSSMFTLALDQGRYVLSCTPTGGVIEHCDNGTYAVTPTEFVTTSSDGAKTWFDWSLADGALTLTLDDPKTLAAHPGTTQDDLRPMRAIYGTHPFTPRSSGAMPPTATTLPDGLYQTALLPVSVVKDTLTAAGFDPAFVDANWPGATTIAFGMQLDSGHLTELDSVNGGPVSIGWRGTAQLQDDHTLLAMASDGDYQAVLSYDIHLEGDALTMRLTSDTEQDTGELSAQTAIYDSAPFTRQP